MEGSQDRNSQDRNLDADTDAEAMEGVAYCLPSPGLLRQLSYSTTSLGMSPLTRGRALPDQSLIKNILTGLPIA